MRVIKVGNTQIKLNRISDTARFLITNRDVLSMLMPLRKAAVRTIMFPVMPRRKETEVQARRRKFAREVR